MKRLRKRLAEWRAKRKRQVKRRNRFRRAYRVLRRRAARSTAAIRRLRSRIMRKRAPLIIPRSQWGAEPPAGRLVRQARVDECFVHHTAYPMLSADASPAQERERMRAIQRQHQESNGWTDIAYPVVVFPSGRAYEGRPEGYQGAHTSGRNSTATAICFDGNFEVNSPTPASIATARRVRARLAPDKPVRPHSAVYSTACPGKHLRSRLKEIAR